jgi:hypothetical protein
MSRCAIYMRMFRIYTTSMNMRDWLNELNSKR